MFKAQLAISRFLGRVLGVETLYFYQKPFPWAHEKTAAPRGRRFGCPSAWGSRIVEMDGTLKPCCYLDEPLGSTLNGPYEETFNNEASRGLRARFLSGDLHSECRECGMLVETTADHVAACLRDARERIEREALSGGTRRMLRSLVERYEGLAREAGLLE